MTERSSAVNEVALAIERLIFKHVKVREIFGGALEFVGTSAAADAILDEINSRAQRTPAWHDWTPDQFWEYVEGLTDTYTRDNMRDTLASKGLSFSSTDSPAPANCSYNHGKATGVE
jgi:hypothetical protein